MLLTRFGDFIFHRSSDAVGILLSAEEAILGLAQGAGGDVISAVQQGRNE